MAESYSIGALAKAGGVGVETIRYYERRKLLQQPPRPYGRIRKYGDAHLERIQFIRRAQSAGFGLNEIESLIRFQLDQSCRETRELAASKLHLIESRLRELKALRSDLKRWIAQCDANAKESSCPTLAALSGADGSNSLRPRREAQAPTARRRKLRPGAR